MIDSASMVCKLRSLATLAALVLCSACTMLHAEEIPLFENNSLDGWSSVDGKPVSKGWEYVDGVVHRKPDKNAPGHIVTKREFGDFELSFDWKIAPRGNSGLKYRVRPYNGQLLGCEYQIIDDNAGPTPQQSSAALYALFEPNNAKRLNPTGEYNTAKIRVQNNHVEHWLNGKKVVDATIGSEEWNRRVANSKFSEEKDFALNARGKIMLTDHGGEVWYRNLKLRELKSLR